MSGFHRECRRHILRKAKSHFDFWVAPIYELISFVRAMIIITLASRRAKPKAFLSIRIASLSGIDDVADDYYASCQFREAFLPPHGCCVV